MRQRYAEYFVNFRPTDGAGYVSKEEFMANRPKNKAADLSTAAAAATQSAG